MRTMCESKVVEVRVDVPSNSEEGLIHRVLVKGTDAEVTCGCPGWKFRGHCRHVTRIERECGWRSDRSAIRQKEAGVCPICGGSTIKVMERQMG